MRYRANINGKEVVIDTSPQYDGFGYTPHIKINGTLLKMFRGRGLERLAAESIANAFIESLGFTRIED